MLKYAVLKSFLEQYKKERKRERKLKVFAKLRVSCYYQARIQEKMNLLKISRFPDFIQYFPDSPQHIPDFSPTKFFKVRKCDRCGSLNPIIHSLVT